MKSNDMKSFEPPAPQQAIYTVGDVAVMLQVHRMTVLRKIRQGELRHFRTNGDSGPYRITQEALSAYIAQQERLVEA